MSHCRNSPAGVPEGHASCCCPAVEDCLFEQPQPAAPGDHAKLLHDLRVLADTSLHATIAGSARDHERATVREAIKVIERLHSPKSVNTEVAESIKVIRALMEFIRLHASSGGFDPRLAEERVNARLDVIAAAFSLKCETCNDNGLIGGPSYSAPDEGGVPCPDCASPAPPAPTAMLGLTNAEVWTSDAIMSCNATCGLHLEEMMPLVQAITRALAEKNGLALAEKEGVKP